MKLREWWRTSSAGSKVLLALLLTAGIIHIGGALYCGHQAIELTHQLDIHETLGDQLQACAQEVGDLEKEIVHERQTVLAIIKRDAPDTPTGELLELYQWSMTRLGELKEIGEKNLETMRTIETARNFANEWLIDLAANKDKLETARRMMEEIRNGITAVKNALSGYHREI